MVDQEHADFATIVGVDGARRVQHGDAVLCGEPGARAHLRLVSLWQCDHEAGRDQRMLAKAERDRCFTWNRGQQIEPGGIRALVGRQRQAPAVRQLLHLQPDAHVATVSAMRVISAAATSSLVIAGQESTLISPPSRFNRCTVLRSPPITPVAGETSLATIQSQPLRLSFALALSIRCSVSAAKPITSGGRLSGSFATVARTSGFSTSCSGGIAMSVFLSFCAPSRATRQSATAAAKIATSTGRADSTCCNMSRAVSTCTARTPGGSSSPTGPVTKVTSAPAACAAAAIAKPCLPEDRLAM